ncbi:MAG: hypothetical protein HON76_06770, partial [Candidatus Scalindua sp.]|nr:hypothetical protein [Candidatus Scalindua sp.]
MMINRLPTLYQDFIHLSRYSRWLDSEKRRETWFETVTRYMDFMKRHLSEDCDYEMTNDVYIEVRDAILNLEVMPSMRALMTAGEALRRENLAAYNCLSGETLVTTKELGVTKIKNLAGSSYHIVDGNGDWVLSPCHSYGKKDVRTIEISTGTKTSFEVNSTLDHRWVLSDGSIKLTSELGVDDRLASVPRLSRSEVDDTSDDYRLGVQHGIFYGDGTATHKFSSGKSTKSMVTQRVCSGFAIRLCGESNELLECFEGFPRSQPKSYNGDNVVYIANSAIDLKSLPEVDTGIFSDTYLIGFLRGWLAADGSISIQSQVSLAANEEGRLWLNKVGVSLGFLIASVSEYPEETNYGVRSQSLFKILLDRRWLVREDFILSYKRERFKILEHSGFGRIKYISETVTNDEVYCFEVPTTQSFLLQRNILTGNCAFQLADSMRAFDEMLYVLLNGAGEGFSVERQFIANLPQLPEKFYDSDTTITVADSKKGWSKAYKELIGLLFAGQVPKWDTSKVRPAGSRLKTFGGRASGPAPLVSLFKYTIGIFKGASGRRLNSLEVHKIFCKIADVVVVGGVRRAALISLSNLSDDRMRHAKSGDWRVGDPELGLSNNSTCYTEKPDMNIFMEEWLALMNSKSGERGIFNREAAKKTILGINERAGYERRRIEFDFGLNPCGEIFLRSRQLCNLSEVVVRAEDTINTLREKIRIATIVGTWQASLTDFKYVSSKWAENCREEALLGVSMTGIMDNKLTNGTSCTPDKLAEHLSGLRQFATDVNKEW